MKTLEKSTATISENGKITAEKAAKKPVTGNASQGNGTAVPAASAPEKSAGLVNKDQPKKVEEVHPNQTKSPAHHALNLENTLQLVEELHRRKRQRDRLLDTIKNLESFEIEQKEEPEETDGNYYHGCKLVIEDDDRNQFATKNPVIIQAVATFVRDMCTERLAEIEAGIVIPA